MAKLLFIIGYALVLLLNNVDGKNNLRTEFAGSVRKTAKNAGHEVVGVRGFAGEISDAQRRESRKSNLAQQIYGKNANPVIVENEHQKLELQKIHASNLLTLDTIKVLEYIYEVSDLTYAKKQSELKIAEVFMSKLSKISESVEPIKTLETELKNALDNGLITINCQRKLQKKINKKLHLVKTSNLKI